MNKSVALFDFNYGDVSHIKTLRTIKDSCDFLAVALKTEPHTKMGEPPLIERYLYLESLECVDAIIPYCTEQDIHGIFHHYDMQTLYISDIYSKTTFTGKDICEKNGIQVRYFGVGVPFTYHDKARTNTWT